MSSSLAAGTIHTRSGQRNAYSSASINNSTIRLRRSADLINTVSHILSTVTIKPSDVLVRPTSAAGAYSRSVSSREAGESLESIPTSL